MTMKFPSEYLYEQALQQKSDVQPHLTLLRHYCGSANDVVELGFRSGVSTAALLAARPISLCIIDWDRPPFEIDRARLEELREAGEVQGTDVKFERSDSLSDEVLRHSDVLFIDTWHTYEHLMLELMHWSDFVERYILIHDTDEPGCPGMFNAVEDFILDNPHWEILLRSRERPGLTVLKRLGDQLCFNYSKVFKMLLRDVVKSQKDLYYKEVSCNESCNPEWRDYVIAMQKRFSDAARWPKTNSGRGATQMVSGL